MPRTRAALRSALAASALIATLSVTGCSLFGGGPQRDEEGKVTEKASLGITDLQIGDCFSTSASGQAMTEETTEVKQSVTVVPCTQEHTDEVFAKGTLTGTTLPTGDDMSEQAMKICDDAFLEYIGNPETDILYASYAAMDNISYATNKTLICAVGLEDGGPLHRSAKGVKTLKALTAK